MPTTIVTGRDLALTIDSKVYDAQASSVVLTRTIDRQEFQTLDGKVYKTIDTAAELAVEMYADWGATGSLCEALSTAAASAVDTSLTFSFTAATGAVFSGKVFPAYPDAGGAAPDAQTVSVTLTVDGSITQTFS